MENDCNYYFLSETALQVWQKNDVNGVKKMYECLTAIYKHRFFKQVVFKSGKMPEHRPLEIAEEVFESTWEDFTLKGIAGRHVFEKPQYTGLFYTIFKRSYIKVLGKEIERVNAEIEYYKNHPGNIDVTIDKERTFSNRTQSVLNNISPNCKQLLIWKYVESLSYEEIAIEKNIDRVYCIKMAWRCKQQFLEIWHKS